MRQSTERNEAPKAKGKPRGKGSAMPRVVVRFRPDQFTAIMAEAKSRHWSFSRLVRHLIDASLEGIP